MRCLRHLAQSGSSTSTQEATAKSKADPNATVIAEPAVQARCESRSTDVETKAFRVSDRIHVLGFESFSMAQSRRGYPLVWLCKSRVLVKPCCK